MTDTKTKYVTQNDLGPLSNAFDAFQNTGCIGKEEWKNLWTEVNKIRREIKTAKNANPYTPAIPK